jgi:regulator of sirC expression with transglutaminase-like and TPR domain
MEPVHSPSLSSAKAEALIKLLDDPAPLVRRAVLDAFRASGVEGIQLLRDLGEQSDSPEAPYARALLLELVGKDPLTQFVEFINSFHYELETGCLMLDRTEFPDMNTGDCGLFLDDIARRAKELLVLPGTTIEKCRVLNRVIFHEYGFRGAVDDFDDPRNSFLHQALERRRGIPITLSIIYVLVAQRCQIDVEPVGIPGRFMVGCYTEKAPFFIDTFEGGAFRTAGDIISMLRRNNLEADERHFAPSPVGEILCRCCRNLANQYQQKNDAIRARRYADLVREFEEAYRRHA